MEKLPTEATQNRNQVAVFNEEKFYQIATKVANDLIIPEKEMPLIKKKAMSFYLAFKQTKDAEKCTQASVEAAFRAALESKLDLSNLKSQAYLIPYGTTLTFQPSYRGKKRVFYENNPDVVEGSMRTNVVYKGDIYQDKIQPNGRTILVKHERPALDKRTNEPLGAYTVITHTDKSSEIMFMSMEQIKRSWTKSRTGATVAKEFPEQMIIRTCEARACTYWGGGSGDITEDEDGNKMFIDSKDNEVPEQGYDLPPEEESIVVIDDSVATSNTNVQDTNAPTIEEQSLNEGEFVIPYKEYLDNKEQYIKISYDKVNKTCVVRKKEENV